MKRLVIILIGLLILLGGVFFWALSQSGPEHASQELNVIDLEDNYEK